MIETPFALSAYTPPPSSSSSSSAPIARARKKQPFTNEEAEAAQFEDERETNFPSEEAHWWRAQKRKLFRQTRKQRSVRSGGRASEFSSPLVARTVNLPGGCVSGVGGFCFRIGVQR
jgi:uncharacterized protein with LGFP repeats